MIRLPLQVYNRKYAPSQARVRAVNYIPSITEMGQTHILGVPHPTNTRLCSSDCKNCPWVDFKDYEECGLRFLRHGPI
jgi:hypothetical protein